MYSDWLAQWRFSVYKRWQVSTPRNTTALCFTPMMRSTCETRPPTLSGRCRRSASTGWTLSDAEIQGDFPVMPFQIQVVCTVFQHIVFLTGHVNFCVGADSSKRVCHEEGPIYRRPKYSNLTGDSIRVDEQRLLF